MTDPVTSNKAFAQPVTGSDVGTWGNPLNANFGSLDALLGGGTPLSLSNVDVTLTQTQANSLYFVLTGVLTANVNVIFPAVGGFYFFINNTTGAFTVTAKPLGGAGAVLARGLSSILMNSTAALISSSIPSGSVLPFYQASAPVGWTQNTSVNDFALRIVSGSGGVSNGSVGLSTFLSDGALSHVLTVGEMPSHNHGVTDPKHYHSFTASVSSTFAGGSGSAGGTPSGSTTALAATGITINNTGGGTGHTHAFDALQYLDFILCTKN